MSLDKLQEKFDEAIDVRESGDLEKSRGLFIKLISKVKNILKSDSPSDLKTFYVTLMGEFVIQNRLEGGKKYLEASKLGEEIYKYDKKNNLKNIFAPRSISHTLQNIGNFEEAEPFLRELIDLAKDNPFRQGDEMSHLSLCLLRTGKIKEARKTIEKAVDQMASNMGSVERPYVAYTRALMFKALILNASGKTKKAHQLVKKSLKLAKREKLPFRIIQAESLDRMFSKLKLRK